jgi:hypothetical protein
MLVNMSTSLPASSERERERLYLTMPTVTNILQHCSQMNEVWVWSSDGLVLTGATRSSRRKTCLNATFITTNPTCLFWDWVPHSAIRDRHFHGNICFYWLNSQQPKITNSTNQLYLFTANCFTGHSFNITKTIAIHCEKWRICGENTGRELWTVVIL